MIHKQRKETAMKKLGFGLMRLPLNDPDDVKNIDRDQVTRMIDRFLAAGYTYFDTAYPYHRGASEKLFGELVADRYPRDAYTLTTKMPVWLINSPEDYDPIFQKQLDRTHAGYFDYYFLHAIGKSKMDVLESTGGFEWIKRKKEDGAVRHIGFSYHDKADLLDEILTVHPEFEVVQLQLNYADWESETVEAHKCYDVCVKHGKPVIVMEPVKGGSLARVPESVLSLMKEEDPDAGAASWAFRFAASLPNVIMVLSGMSNMEQLEENVALFDDMKPLNDKEQKVIEKSVKILKESVAVKCTGCRYCTEGCPENIAIPDYFSLYNSMKLYGYVPSMSTMFTNLIVEHGKPSDCIGCGQCESICPQKLNIIEDLAKVKEAFETE